MTSNKSRILIRVQPGMKTALAKMAADQGRSLSNLIEQTMKDQAKAGGYLAEPKKKPRP